MQLDLLIREKELVDIMISKNGLTIELNERLNNVMININRVIGRLPRTDKLMGRDFECDYRRLYEVIVNGLKNVMVAIQNRRATAEKETRGYLVNRIRYMEEKFGIGSEQAEEQREKLFRFDDNGLKERANRFRDFLEKNNEKATKAFCKLSKEGGTNDDISQIKGDDGGVFPNSAQRGEHIRKFYENLYKKRLDPLMSVEEFLGGRICNEDWVTDRKLSGEERESLEIAVTMEELKESMEKSNFESTSGWDGISFKVIRHFWDLLSHPMLKMVNETFLRGELMDSFKLGLIKLIPKKGKAEKVGDWRPITLLCCGYKLISGIVAKRLEKYLMKIIGRAQKGFLKQKSIHTCTDNIMTCISQAWIEQEECGVMCVDFKKAFDSVEHAAIKMILEFFNFGEIMVGMVMTLLNSRISRVIVEDGYSDSLGITRGTPQGDRSSPYIFIIVIEILLIKLKGMDGHGIECCDFI